MKIKSTATNIILAYAAVQAARGWYMLVESTIEHIKTRKK